MDIKSNEFQIGLIDTISRLEARAKHLFINVITVNIWIHEAETEKEKNTNHIKSYLLPDIPFNFQKQTINDS